MTFAYGLPSVVSMPLSPSATVRQRSEYMKLFQNHDFRVALSISIDREIIESAFLGLGEAPASPQHFHYYPGDEHAQIH